MPLPTPRLDDRTFEQMVAEARDLIPNLCPDWTDLGPSDPGIALVELFAFLTETLLYRVNRAPDKLRINLLNLVGLMRRPPAAASVDLEFRRKGAEGAVNIPAGARVASPEGVVFTVVEGGVLGRDDQTVRVRALNCDFVEGEMIGRLDGLKAAIFNVERAPIIAVSGEGPDVVVGVEVSPGEIVPAGAPTRAFEGVTYRIWDEGLSADGANGANAYLLDRAEGVIRFPPRSAAAPEWRPQHRLAGASGPAGPRVRVWYRTGGGRAGNVPRDALRVLKSGPAGVEVRNLAAAIGGADAESVEDAVLRAPLEVSSHEAAVTARDYERIARSVGGVPWARALAQAAQWSHGAPGVVDVLIMPPISRREVEALPERAVTPELVKARRAQAAPILDRIDYALKARRPLGVRTTVDWVQVLRVSVEVSVVADEVTLDGLEARLRARLNDLFSPLRDIPAGRTLKASDIYETLLAEPGVRYIEPPRMSVRESPTLNVVDVIRDPHQPNGWFVASSTGVHRSLDDGGSWSQVYPSPPRRTADPTTSPPAPSRAIFVRRHSRAPGVLAVGLATERNGEVAYSVRVSRDCGETWLPQASTFRQRIFDADWVSRDGAPVLLVASDAGLFEVSPGEAPKDVQVGPAVDGKGAYAVAATASSTGQWTVAVAASGLGGVFVSRLAGAAGSFTSAGLKGKDIRVLLLDVAEGRNRLWAGASATGGAEGEGVFEQPLDGGGERTFPGWKGGSCEGLAQVGQSLFAGSNRGGFLRLDAGQASPAWSMAKLSNGLPLSQQSDDERKHAIAREFAIVRGVAAGRPANAPDTLIVFAVGPEGVFRYRAGGAQLFADGWHFELASRTEFTDRVPLPRNWLYCSGEHKVTLLSDAEADHAA